MVARQLTAATHFPGQFLTRQAGTGEQCSPLQKFFARLNPKYSGPPHGSLPHRLRAEPPRRGGQGRGARLSGNEIRRGAFYMRPRKFALPQTARADMESAPTFFEGRALPVPCPLCQHHQRQLYEHGCRLLVLSDGRGAVYLLDCHVQLKLLLVFIHKL